MVVECDPLPWGGGEGEEVHHMVLGWAWYTRVPTYGTAEDLVGVRVF